MTSPARTLLPHPVIRSLVFERLLLVASAPLAASALVSGRVKLAPLLLLVGASLLLLRV